jgi:hypothetical protein
VAQKADAGSKSRRNMLDWLKTRFLSLIKHRNDCIQQWITYRSAFESAEDEIKGFKSLLLMDLESLEAYITDTRIQARHSFRLCVFVALCGALLLFVAIGLGIASQVVPHMPPLQIAYLTAVAGMITQLISGVFFYFYHMALRQINLFHSQLESSRKVCISLYLQSLMTESPSEQNKAKLALIKLLASAGRSDQFDHADEGETIKKPHEAETISATSS